jgi:hypothetical protein
MAEHHGSAVRISYLRDRFARVQTGIQAGRGHEARYQTTGGGGTAYLVQRYRVGVPDSVVSTNASQRRQLGTSTTLVFLRRIRGRCIASFSPGVRIELFNSYYPRSPLRLGRFIAARNFPAEAVSEQPHWKDIAPRFRVVYDLLGDNTTAVKASWGRYVPHVSRSLFLVLQPDDADERHADVDEPEQGRYRAGRPELRYQASPGIPGCEIGPPEDIGSNDASSGIRHQRPTNTEFSASVQRQIIPGMSAAGGYTRRDYQRIIFTQNIAVQPLGRQSGRVHDGAGCRVRSIRRRC